MSSMQKINNEQHIFIVLDFLGLFLLNYFFYSDYLQLGIFLFIFFFCSYFTSI